MNKIYNNTHVHHYTVAMIVLSITGYQHVFVTVIHGLFNGIMIEGASRWGYDPVWTNY